MRVEGCGARVEGRRVFVGVFARGKEGTLSATRSLRLVGSRESK